MSNNFGIFAVEAFVPQVLIFLVDKNGEKLVKIQRNLGVFGMTPKCRPWNIVVFHSCYTISEGTAQYLKCRFEIVLISEWWRQNGSYLLEKSLFCRSKCPHKFRMGCDVDILPFICWQKTVLNFFLFILPFLLFIFLISLFLWENGFLSNCYAPFLKKKCNFGKFKYLNFRKN